MRRYVDNIMIAGRRAKSLAERLLAFTRPESELHAGDAAVTGDSTQNHRGFESHPLSGGPQEELSAVGKPSTEGPRG
jgi:hypothetical protein